jgi:predicted amidophosphoribosyltransferase
MWDWVFPSLCAVCGEPTYTQERRVCWRCFFAAAADAYLAGSPSE